MDVKIISMVAFTTFVTITSTIFYVYVVRKKTKGQKIPQNWKSVGTVKKLFIFPLKSGRYKEIDTIECTEFGFRLLKSSVNPMQLRDRSFVVFGEQDKHLKSSKTFPVLVKVDVSVHDESTVVFSAPEIEPLYVKIPHNKKENLINLSLPSGEKIKSLDCGNDAAKWFTKLLSGKTNAYRLAFHDASTRRDLVRHRKELKFYKNMTDASTGLFSDFTSLHILNQASFDEYKKRAPDANVTTMNFRANIIVGGPQLKAHDEDNWDWMRIGDSVIVRAVKDCTRCAVTTIDQETGKRNLNHEPLKTLSTFRISHGPEKLPVMGYHLEVKQEGIINTEDILYLGYN